MAATSLSDARARNIAGAAALAPLPDDRARLALVVGGTSGIGRGIAVRLAATGLFDVLIVARNEVAAAEVVAEMRAATPPSTVRRFAFLRCDAKLVAAAYACAAAAMQTPAAVARAAGLDGPTLDVLVLSPGVGRMEGRVETSEGLDRKLALHFFGRMAFADALLPSLQRAASAGFVPHVLTVLAAGVHPPYLRVREDFEIKKDLTFVQSIRAACLYTDIMSDAFARDSHGVAFVHAYPGFVATNWGGFLPLPVRAMLGCVRPFLAKSLYYCGELMSLPFLAAAAPGDAMHGVPGLGRSGHFLMGEFGQEAKHTAVHDELRDFVFAETLRVLHERRGKADAGAK